MKMNLRRPTKGQVSLAPPDTVIEQAGALCLRVSSSGKRQVLLVGSRRNGRWGLPKGHIDPGETSQAAALREAYEEAGIRGNISDEIVGSFAYLKDSSPSQYRVIVHLLEVGLIEDTYPEKGLRSRHWFTLADAADAAGHEGLRKLFRALT